MKGKGKTKSEKVWTSLLFTFSLLLFTSIANAAELPAGYTQVEYIESTNGGGQYIDTEYTHKSNTRVECSVNVASEQEQGYPVIFGSYNGSYQSNAFAFFAKFFPEKYGENTPPALGHTGYEQVGEPNSFPYDTRVDLVCEETQASWRRFGETSVCGSISNAGTAADDGVWPMNIFVNNNNGAQSGNTWCAMRLYSFRIYEGDALKRDFVPCVEKSSGNAGLWDCVEGGFYPNAGNGKFLTEEKMPAGYRQVEYIESTKGGGQYIDTEYTANANTRVEMDAYLPPVEKQNDDSVVLFGTRTIGTWSEKAFSIQLLGLKCI